MPQHLLIPNYRFKTSAPPKRTPFPLMNKGVVAYPKILLKATTTSEAGKPTGESSNGVVVVEDVPPVVKDECDETMKVEPPEEDPPTDEQIDLFGEFFNKFNVKLDSADSYSIILHGSGALVAVWFLSAIVGAVDSIPLFPKMMEVVGLGYTFWFSTRYLICKVLGSSDE